MFLLWLRWFPWCGDRTPASAPQPAEGRSSPTNTPVSPPSSFILLSFAWFCIFFSTGHILLSVLIWCSACTSVSDSVFLMYLWREIYSMSTYSSAILFSLSIILFLMTTWHKHVWADCSCHLTANLWQFPRLWKQKAKEKRQELWMQISKE